MTGNDIIALVDKKEPNSYTADEKLRWLSNLDGKIFNEVITQYEEYDPETDEFTPYEDGSEELLVGAPYGEDMYVHYLIARIAGDNAEASRYNQQIAMYNTCYSQWWNRYNATHMPLSKPRFRF